MPLFLLPFIAGAKSFLGALITFCSKPPGSYIAIAVAILIGLWWYGRHEFNKGVQSVKVAQAAMTARIIERQSNINVQLGNIYVPKLVFIQTETQRIIADVPKHITPEIDRQFPVPLGFVRVWNDAAHGPVPAPAAGSDADPSGVPLSDVATAHTEDAGTLDVCRTYLAEWWDWYDKNALLFKASK